MFNFLSYLNSCISLNICAMNNWQHCIEADFLPVFSSCACRQVVVWGGREKQWGEGCVGLSWGGLCTGGGWDGMVMECSEQASALAWHMQYNIKLLDSPWKSNGIMSCEIMLVKHDWFIRSIKLFCTFYLDTCETCMEDNWLGSTKQLTLQGITACAALKIYTSCNLFSLIYWRPVQHWYAYLILRHDLWNLASLV